MLAITYVSSALTLIAFIVAIAARVQRNQTLGTERRIRLAPVADRAALVERTLEFFSIDTAALTPEQCYNLAIRQIDARAARFRTISWLVFALAIVTAAIAIYSGTSRAAESGPTVATGALHLERVTPDGIRIARMQWREFTVRVADVKGHPVSGIKIVWQTPQGGPKVYVTETDNTGICAATNLYTFNNAGVYTQLATVAAPDTPIGFSTADNVQTLGPSITFNFLMQ